MRDCFLDLVEVSLLYRMGLGGIMESYPWLTFTVFLLILLVACFTMRNTQEKVKAMKFSIGKTLVTVGLLL